MKRSRSQVSREMSPGVNDEGFLHKQQGNEIFTAGKADNDSHVIVAGAGPAGLMLAYGPPEAPERLYLLICIDQTL
jgi:hypothetical protein